jgi:hypothetical protein
MSFSTRGSRLVGGIVAYGDGARIMLAIRSLRTQRLPKGAAWTKIWVVVSPDTVGTARYARLAAAGDPRIEVIEEADRRGKSAALSEIFRRASGDILVLLNGDAEAEPGAVARLIRASGGARLPFGVMARPSVPPGGRGPMYGSYQLLWALHHRLHAELYASGERTHLSDELLALSIERLPPMGPGVINDGACLGAWIHGQGGELRYAENARVRISLPARAVDHIAQRRRIFVGPHQTYSVAGLAEPTLVGLAVRDPAAAARLIWSEVRRQPGGFLALTILCATELVAQALGVGDRARGTTNYGIWPRVGIAATEPVGAASVGRRQSA